MQDTKQLLNEKEVAAALKISVASARRWRVEGRGPRFIKLGACVRYRAEDLDAWLASRPSGGQDTGHERSAA